MNSPANCFLSLFIHTYFCDYSLVNSADILSRNFVKKVSMVGPSRLLLPDSTLKARTRLYCASLCVRMEQCNYFHFKEGGENCQLMATEELDTGAGKTIFSKVGYDSENGYWRIRGMFCRKTPPIGSRASATRKDCIDYCDADPKCTHAPYELQVWCFKRANDTYCPANGEIVFGEDWEYLIKIQRK